MGAERRQPLATARLRRLARRARHNEAMATASKAPLTPGPGRDTPRSRTLSRPAWRAARAPRPQPAVLNQAPEPEEAPAQALVSRGLGAAQRVAAVVAVLVLLFAACVPSLIVYFNQQRQLVAVQQEIAARQADIDAMRSELARWQDPAYVSAQARERLGWVVPGETGYVVLGPDGQPLGGANVSPGTQPSASAGPATWYQRLWGSVLTADNPQPG